MGSIVLNPGVKEMLLNDTKDFLKSEKVSIPLSYACVALPMCIRSGTQIEEFHSAEATFCMVFQDPESRLLFTQLPGS